MTDLLYPSLVYVHLLLFVLWLGADVGVYLLGQHFRRRDDYTLDQRLALLKLLVIVDMTPRSAWALMVPLSITVARAGGWWPAPLALVAAAWAISGLWLWLVWDAHRHDQTPRAARNRRVETVIRWLLALFYLGLGGISLASGEPIAVPWLSVKALLFGLIFVAAIMIDVRFRAVGPHLLALIRDGSSDATEIPLRTAMDRARRWVLLTYVLLVVCSWLGVVKPSL